MSQPPSGQNSPGQNPFGGDQGSQPGQPYGQQPGQPHGQQPGQPYGQQQPGQQQPGQQQPGQPGFDQQGGYQQFAGGQPEQQPKKKVSIKTIATIVIIVVGLGIAAFGWFGDWQRDQALQVGQCVTVEGEPDDVDISSSDCDADASEGIVYEVVEVNDGAATCEQPLVSYTEETSRRGFTSTDKTVCLGEVLVEGQCYEEFEGLAGVRSVDCPGGDFKVTKVEETAESTCDESVEVSLTYPSWNKNYCLGEPA